MASNPLVVRFQIGQAYRLAASNGGSGLLGGTLTILSEIKPADTWGNRILLGAVSPDTAQAPEIVRLFVEEGYATFADSYGVRTVPSEIATAQGLYPHSVKAYAIDGIPAATPYRSA